MRARLRLVIAFVLASTANALVLLPARLGCTRSGHSVARTCVIQSTSSSDEIAELEARLAELKRKEELKQIDVSAGDGTVAEAVGISEEPAEGFDLATLSSRKKVAAVKTAAPAELLSEAWKEEEMDAAGEGTNVVQIVGGLALAIGLVAFSQVPIGQNIDQATYGGVTPPPPSAAEIRKLYEGELE